MEQSPDPGKTRAPRWWGRVGLSGKLLLLTLFFVMLAEVLIYVPSIANFRMVWLGQHVEAARLATLALKATPTNAMSDAHAGRLLARANVLAVVVEEEDARQLILMSGMPPRIDRNFDLREQSKMRAIWDAFDALFAPADRIIAVTDTVQPPAGDTIQVVLDENLLKSAMVKFSINVLSLSIVISLITGGLVYLAIIWLLIRPIRRLTATMVRFGEAPEEKDRVIVPSNRGDEIGRAENELATMQVELQSLLKQKAHLASLGLAVSKINHDLRNILAHAQLLSDRMVTIKDPTVQRLAPKLIGSLGRAIELCTNTLKFGQAREAPPDRRRIRLAPLVDEVGETLDIANRPTIVWRNQVDHDTQIDADPDQLFRVVMNLARNAVQALGADSGVSGVEGEVRISARREGTVVTIEVSDTGPGVPAQARSHLFEAFKGSSRAGGVGLGLAIAAELTQAHGGEIRLLERTIGATFEVVIPDTVATINVGKKSQAV
ncbi:MAG: sensor histidine kinase [Alphaproteobacteria bacterium]